MRRNANEENILNITAEANELMNLGYTEIDFLDGDNFYLPEDMRNTYSWEEGEQIYEAMKITTLEQLADYINRNDDYDTMYVEYVCNKNGWNIMDDEWHICNNGQQQVMFTDSMDAVVVDL